MKLSNQYRYIGLDFETTGLDVTKDEPIQIGLVELDASGKVIKEFQSLIKPDKKTDELKHIVGFITGLSISDLETAPTRDEVAEKIKNFFKETGDVRYEIGAPDHEPRTMNHEAKKIILIGHNISFDINFLNSYFPGNEFIESIDTFQLAQALVHYAQSYALEVLIQHLQVKEPRFNGTLLEINNGQLHDDEKSHDALYDTKESLALFLFLMQTIQNLGETYPALKTIRSQSEGIIAKIREANTPASKLAIKFPSLSRLAASNTGLKTSKEKITRENQKRYYVGNVDIKELIRMIASEKHCILAFQNIQKLDIAKKILSDLGVKSVGFVKEDQTISETIFKDFLNKGTFTQGELLFICKYLSHLDKGYGTLDLNCQMDRRIYHAIKDSRDKAKLSVVLATHPGIYTMMTEENNFPDYDIFFFDVERRYKTYNYYLSRPCDLYYTLGIIESLIYKEQVHQQIKGEEVKPSEQLNNFYNFFQVFIGVLFADTKKIFTKTDAIYIPHDPIVGHGDFYQSDLLWKQMPDHLQHIAEVLSKEDFDYLTKQIEHIDKIFNGVVSISKKMYTQSDFYFVYAEAQRYTDRKEFTEIFKNNAYFLSNSNIQYENLPVKGGAERTGGGGFDGARKPTTKIPTRNLGRLDDIATHIEKTDKKVENIFIFSPRKEESKKMFEDLCQKDIHKQALILVENITGGVGKNVFKAAAPGKKVIIGGNNFLLYLYSNGVQIDEIILFNSKGGNEQSILQDIQRYYPK